MVTISNGIKKLLRQYQLRQYQYVDLPDPSSLSPCSFSIPHFLFFPDCFSISSSLFWAVPPSPHIPSQSFQPYRKWQAERERELPLLPGEISSLSLWAAERHRKTAKGNSAADKQQCRSHQTMSSYRSNHESDTDEHAAPLEGRQHFLCSLLLFSSLNQNVRLNCSQNFMTNMQRRESITVSDSVSLALIPDDVPAGISLEVANRYTRKSV